EAIWAVTPGARMVHADPVLHIMADPSRPHDRQAAEGHRLAQYQAWDLLAGRLWPLVGGHPKYLDIIGVNYYFNNQWIHGGPPIERGHRLYRPFRKILAEVHERYQRPLFIAEAGIEGARRPEWLGYVGAEVRAALRAGVPLEGVCLYPIVNHPGWDDERHCHNGLWDYADAGGEREIYQPLAHELRRQQRLLRPLQPQTMPASQDAVRQPTPRTPGKHESDRATVCLFTDSLEPSGMGEHMLTLAAELVSNYQVLFVCPGAANSNLLRQRATALGCITLALDVRNGRVIYQALGEWLQRMRVDIFHCHAGIGWEGHDGVYVARSSGVPVVVRTEHLPYLLTDREQQLMYTRALDMVDHIICVSGAAHLSYRQAGVPADKLTTIRNGIQVQPVQPDRAGVRAQFGLPTQAKLVLTVARMTEQKGHRYLLEAVPTVLTQVPDAHFIWVGEGPLEGELRRQLESGHIDPTHLIFAGWRKDVPHLLAASDLFVLPSLFEGLPLVALEALAAGVPVVGTRVSGTAEAIEDGVTGRLVAAQDSAALAAAIVEALTQPALITQWQVAGRQQMEKIFSAARMADEVITLYERLRTARRRQPVLQLNQPNGSVPTGVTGEHTNGQVVGQV
ncbi:MAG: glycosyltransferase, partial [Chloroflexota bacterium]|nr:glycosyltransferase [Chloroflexota bacterium]